MDFDETCRSEDIAIAHINPSNNNFASSSSASSVNVAGAAAKTMRSSCDLDTTLHQMFGYRVFAPFVLSAVFGLTVTSWCMTAGPMIYVRSIPPYQDTGFSVSPDYSSGCYAINTTLAIFHFAVFAAFCMLHVRRLTVMRRVFLVWGVVQLVEFVQFYVTRLPDPSAVMTSRGGRVYAMHPAQYVCFPLFVQYYSAQSWPKVIFWVLSFFAWAILVPTRMYYTIDIICAIFVAVFVFMTYHWYVRTVTSIRKRPYLIHLEYDVVHGVADDILNQHSFFRQMNWFNLMDQKYETAVYAAVDGRGPSAESRQYLRASHPQLASLGSPRSSLSDYRLDYSDAGNEIVQELVDRAERLIRSGNFSPIRHQIMVTGIFLIFGAAIGFLNLVSVHVADTHRPIHVAIADDVLFTILPLVPEHTADFCLFPLLLMVITFSVLSPWRFVLLRRTGLVYGMAMFFRLFTVPATFPPDPSANCVERQHEPGTTCGDLIYSGHTISFILAAFAVRYYSRNRMFERLLWSFVGFGLLAIIASRLHYTRDVFTSLLVVLSINHFCRVALFKRVDRIKKSKWLEWFERDAYLLLLEETASTQEGRPSTYDWIGRICEWWNIARNGTISRNEHSNDEHRQQPQPSREEDTIRTAEPKKTLAADDRPEKQSCAAAGKDDFCSSE